MRKRLYLAYGSNLNMRQMTRRCPGAICVGASELTDYQLMFRGSGSGYYLTVEPCEGSTVPVGVWEVTAQDEKELDRYEGFPKFYTKVEIELPVRYSFNGGTRKRKAFFYVMTPGRSLGLPSVGYVGTCASGYTDFCFDKQPLIDALLRVPVWEEGENISLSTNWLREAPSSI